MRGLPASITSRTSVQGRGRVSLRVFILPIRWATLHNDTSRPFEKPKSGRIAVKVINHLGDEVMKVFKVT